MKICIFKKQTHQRKKKYFYMGILSNFCAIDLGWAVLNMYHGPMMVKRKFFFKKKDSKKLKVAKMKKF